MHACKHACLCACICLLAFVYNSSTKSSPREREVSGPCGSRTTDGCHVCRPQNKRNDVITSTVFRDATFQRQRAASPSIVRVYWCRHCNSFKCGNTHCKSHGHWGGGDTATAASGQQHYHCTTLAIVCTWCLNSRLRTRSKPFPIHF